MLIHCTAFIELTAIVYLKISPFVNATVAGFQEEKIKPKKQGGREEGKTHHHNKMSGKQSTFQMCRSGLKPTVAIRSLPG